MRSPLGLFSVSGIQSPFGHHLVTSLLTSAHIAYPLTYLAKAASTWPLLAGTCRSYIVIFLFDIA